MQDDIMVSVACIAYNHEKYIRRALEGFVSQKTNFKYEIIVHDDASPDSTADIIREYEAKYPELIRAIYQTENQYSQGKSVRPFVAALVRGKYVAICEGDDYWTDPYKLQKQFDALEAHPEVDLCAHGAEKFVDGKFFQSIKLSDVDTLIPTERVIEDGGRVATCSLFLRAERYLVLPAFAPDGTTNDFMVRIDGSLRGGMYYLADIMGVYDQQTSGTSYTASVRKNSAVSDRMYAHRRAMMDLLDKHTEGKYSASIRKYLERMETSMLLDERSKASFKKIKKEYKSALKRFPKIKQIYVNIGAVSPALAEIFIKICRVARAALGK